MIGCSGFPFFSGPGSGVPAVFRVSAARGRHWMAVGWDGRAAFAELGLPVPAESHGVAETESTFPISRFNGSTHESARGRHSDHFNVPGAEVRELQRAGGLFDSARSYRVWTLKFSLAHVRVTLTVSDGQVFFNSSEPGGGGVARPGNAGFGTVFNV
eukprot:762510-Hanusia_phi.AAC.7